MKYLVVDASLNGTGIRDKYEGGYINPESLLISADFIKRLKDWLLRYENEHYNEYKDADNVKELDKEGRKLAIQLKNGLSGTKVDYYSDALLTNEPI